MARTKSANEKAGTYIQYSVERTKSANEKALSYNMAETKSASENPQLEKSPAKSANEKTAYNYNAL
jgi:hypothetical protein